MDNQIVNQPTQTSEASPQVIAPVPLPLANPTTEPSQNPPKNSNLLIITLVVVTIIIGIIFGVLVTKLLSDSKKSATPPVSFSNNVEGTENWIFYSNSKVEYSIKHPPTWTLTEKSRGILIEIKDPLDYSKPIGKILVEKIVEIPRNNFDYIDEKNIGNISTLCFTDEILDTRCYFENGKSEIISFLITRDNEEINNLTLDKILQTFSSTSKAARISTKQLLVGWYWGNKEQKLEGTPPTWIYKDAGKSSCWHRFGVTCK